MNNVVKMSTKDTKKLFLESFPETFTITETVKRCGISRSTFYLWLETDPEFAKAFVDAKNAAIEVLENEARRRAFNGVEKPVYQGGKEVGKVREYSDTLLMFLLKGLNPGKYRDGTNINLNDNCVEVKRIIYNFGDHQEELTGQTADGEVKELPEGSTDNEKAE